MRLSYLFGLSLLYFAAPVLGDRTRFLLNSNFLFKSNQLPQCSGPGDFPIDLSGYQCQGLSQASAATDAQTCEQACCNSPSLCDIWQWCDKTDPNCSPSSSCWIGTVSSITDKCNKVNGWISQGRNSFILPKPGDKCNITECDPNENDKTSEWSQISLPHDFVVHGTFNNNSDMAHGYLPFGIGFYRRHFELPSDLIKTLNPKSIIYFDFQGIQTYSSVWLNGVALGSYTYGYTPSRYYVNVSQLNTLNDNLLAVRVDSTKPDGWWYDGGGIYRDVWLTIISNEISHGNPEGLSFYFAPEGTYIPSIVSGPITFSSLGFPTSSLVSIKPTVEINTSPSTNVISFPLTLKFVVSLDSTHDILASLEETVSVIPNNASFIWNPNQGQPIQLMINNNDSNIPLWHTGPKLASAALFTVSIDLIFEGKTIDQTQVRSAARKLAWDGATGFYLNGVNTKIKGMANHQDFGGLGVAVPDHLQWHRISRLQDLGANGWRTAHNPPNPSLLHAADELGFLVWDENHRNGQDDQTNIMVRRDRNHPSIIIWSLCNEVLCDTGANSVTDALRLKKLIQQVDPDMQRVVSANYNTFVGTQTPLDVQGFDYATSSYDQWHQQAPNIPSISSETSSAVSDRDEYTNDSVGGHVSGYDTNYPGWGQSAAQAWGGVGEPNNQGILTRSFIAGGWVWTGWDYKGEPTPYSWPDINSHFGILDIVGNAKDRFYWYSSWFTSQPSLYLFPHWNWNTNPISSSNNLDEEINNSNPTGIPYAHGSSSSKVSLVNPNSSNNVSVWIFSNFAETELLLNDQSLGRQTMPKYGHTEWSVPFVPGSLQARGYNQVGDQHYAIIQFRNTTGNAYALKASIRPLVSSKSSDNTLKSGCSDIVIVDVVMVDQNNNIVPTANDVVTFTVNSPSGTTEYVGGGNGDPTCHVSDSSASRPLYHGRVTGLIMNRNKGINEKATVTVSVNSASASGDSSILPASVDIQVVATGGEGQIWCNSQYDLI